MTAPCLDRTTRRLIAPGAILAPALHILTDAMEWIHGGFFPVLLWINDGAFVFFSHTTLLALALATPNDADLWRQLGSIDTLHDVLMIVARTCFGWATLQAGVASLDARMVSHRLTINFACPHPFGVGQPSSTAPVMWHHH